MSRPPNPDLSIAWKIHLPATTAGKTEFMLLDPIHNKPKYGARNKLIAALLERWIAEQERRPVPDVPTQTELLETP